MPGFGGQIDPQSVPTILEYIKSTWPKEIQAIQQSLNAEDMPSVMPASRSIICNQLCSPAATTQAQQQTP
jgi:hypothetical protein